MQAQCPSATWSHTELHPKSAPPIPLNHHRRSPKQTNKQTKGEKHILECTTFAIPPVAYSHQLISNPSPKLKPTNHKNLHLVSKQNIP